MWPLFINVLWGLVQEIAYARVKLRMEWEAVLLVHVYSAHSEYHKEMLLP